jgi:RNA polymerase sigma factor (sigma-70 family)
MESNQSGGNPKMSEATDEQLFALMARRGEEAKEAWETFYRRYLSDFHRLVCRLPGVSPSQVEDLVQDTMVKAWKSAHTFRGREDGDADSARRRALAWLGRIARNHNWETRRRKIALVNDSAGQEDEDERASHQNESRSRRLSKLHREVEQAVNRVAGVVKLGAEGDSIRRQLLRGALATLSDRERAIVIATYEHYEPGQEQQRRLPKEAVDDICRKFKITSENLRQIRRRTDAKIRQFVTEHMPAEMRG